jgi:aryl-alcohol dehydrogenase-like predicted oxidoreductase
MQYRSLGDTGVQVSNLCLGTMMFGGVNNADHDDCVDIIHTALDAGINFVDTADVYSQGESEEIVGKALQGRRDDVVLATKFQGAMGDERNHHGASRRWIVAEVENSLRRLGTDHIDLYQLHRPNPGTNIEETLGALDDLVRAGKVLYIGHSAFQASQIVEAQWAARDRLLVRPVSEQLSYSLLVRTPEIDVLPTALRHHMSVICYSPLAGGWLSGKWRKGVEAPTPSTGRGASGLFKTRVRPRQPGERRQARRGRCPRCPRRGQRHVPRGAGNRVRREPPGHHERDHRPAHHGPAHDPVARG